MNRLHLIYYFLNLLPSGIGERKLFYILRYKAPAPCVELVVESVIVKGFDERGIFDG